MSINKLKTELRYTVLTVIEIACIPIETICGMKVSISCAGFTKVIPYRISIGISLDKANTGIHISISSEVVILAINNHPCALITTRTVIVPRTISICIPSTRGYTIYIKDKDLTVNKLFTEIKLIISARVAVLTIVGILPAGLENVVDSVVEVAVHLEDAGAGSVYIVASCTYELAVNKHVLVAKLLNYSPPFYNRLTGLTIGTIGISVCSTGCSYIGKSCKLCVVDVIGRGNCSKLGCNVDAAAEGCAVNSTGNDLTVDVYNGLVAHFRRIKIALSHIIESIVSPNTYGNAYNNACLCLRTADCLNGNGKKLGNCVVRVGSLEAVSNNCAIELPSVCVVQLKNCNKLIYVCKVGNVDVYVVDRLCLRSFAGVIVTTEFNGCVACNGEGTGDLHGVAKLVLDLERNSVNTCSENNVLRGRERAACYGSLYLNAVNSDLTGGKVKSSVISNLSGECDLIAVDSCAVFERCSCISGRIGGSRNCRKNSVIYSRAVVKSNVIDIECNVCGECRLYISTNEGRRTGVLFICCNRCAEIIVLRNIDSSVNPTRFGNICIGSRV